MSTLKVLCALFATSLLSGCTSLFAAYPEGAGASGAGAGYAAAGAPGEHFAPLQIERRFLFEQGEESKWSTDYVAFAYLLIAPDANVRKKQVAIRMAICGYAEGPRVSINKLKRGVFVIPIQKHAVLRPLFIQEQISWAVENYNHAAAREMISVILRSQGGLAKRNGLYLVIMADHIGRRPVPEMAAYDLTDLNESEIAEFIFLQIDNLERGQIKSSRDMERKSASAYSMIASLGHHLGSLVFKITGSAPAHATTTLIGCGS